jgi:hydroxymethylpyrimidine pyrophosphatase-like HAD family hydrolase
VRATSERAATAFAKISVFEAPVPLEQIAREIGAVIARLGIEQENTVAVGDGQNDLEMIAFAGVGIAIEGSSPELLALADRVAAPPHREGLVDAFAELGLI